MSWACIDLNIFLTEFLIRLLFHLKHFEKKRRVFKFEPFSSTMHLSLCEFHASYTWYMIYVYFFRLVEWLDGSTNGSYRQAQISFSSRIPSAIPMGDAVSLQPALIMYYNLENVSPVAAVSMKVSAVNKTNKHNCLFYIFTIV